MPIIAIHEATSTGLNRAVQIARCEDNNELGVTSALAFDLVETAINDSSAFAVGIMYSVFTGSWIGILSLIILQHLVRKWFGLLKINNGIDALDTYISPYTAAVECILLILGGAAYRYLKGT